MNLPIFERKTPRRGHLFVAVYEEPTDVSAIIKRQSGNEGVEQIANVVHAKEHCNYRGWVVGVGVDVKGLAWGDEVALKQWGGTWWNAPFRWFDGQYTNEGIYQAADGRQIKMENDHYLLVCEPEMITFRHGTFEKQNEFPEPIFSRLLVRHVDRDDMNVHRSGLILGGYGVSEINMVDGAFGKVARDFNPPPLAQVVSTGFHVKPDDFRVGDWVLCEEGHGTLIVHAGKEYGMIESEHVPVNFGPDKPAEKVAWVCTRNEECA